MIGVALGRGVLGLGLAHLGVVLVQYQLGQLLTNLLADREAHVLIFSLAVLRLGHGHKRTIPVLYHLHTAHCKAAADGQAGHGQRVIAGFLQGIDLCLNICDASLFYS